MELPRELLASLDGYPDGLGRRWVAELPAWIAAAEERWGITIGPPFQPGGVTSFAAPAESSSGEPCVYKITVPHPEALGEADALQAYEGDGAVRLLAHEPDTYEVLLERATPGTELWDVPDDDTRLSVACDLMRRLWRPCDSSAITTLEAAASAWADVTERRVMTTDLPWVTDPIERGIDLLRRLPCEPHEAVLIHGDFHPGNILSADREPWLAIDPKPLVGDPAFEPMQLLSQRGGRIAEPGDAAAVEERLVLIAGMAGLDPARIGLWSLARAAEWSMWSWDHGDTIDAAIAYTWARTLDTIIDR
ncbi:MAG: aminoglycoside phosphotransferase family protein [Acidimicrobiia bacterium]|nr:aminoglycoside phosphotransferase family protein [Acidimicrobiia bacterium]